MTKAHETFSTTSEKNDSKRDTLSLPLSSLVLAIRSSKRIKKNKGTMINVRLYLHIFLSF